jgi:hypothetical protein
MRWPPVTKIELITCLSWNALGQDRLLQTESLVKEMREA